MIALAVYLTQVGVLALNVGLYVADGGWWNLAAAIFAGALAIWTLALEVARVRGQRP